MKVREEFVVVRYVVCPRCNYRWAPKVQYPRECTRCKARLDLEEDEMK